MIKDHIFLGKMPVLIGLKKLIKNKNYLHLNFDITNYTRLEKLFKK